MYYTRLTVRCSQEIAEMMIAELADAGFDAFMETESGFEAFAEEDRYDAPGWEHLRVKYQNLAPITFSFDKIEKQNWNEEWEKNYQPINVEDQCLIRAEFHKTERSYPYEVIITPKMSFGTGHHQTTYLMVKNQMATDYRGMRVMDAGCGTAILSIMACKLGATEVEAFDIDEWSVINGKENIDINGCNNIHLQQGRIDEVKLAGRFDIILANINKNVLMAEMKTYSSYLDAGGLLLLSGFYTHDIPDLLNTCSQYSLAEVRRDERETWACLLMQRH